MYATAVLPATAPVKDPARNPDRNLVLDFFRGLALVVIFINHMPYNPWYWGTPSRFGFSDATEIFIFISGYVAALAYGRRFTQGLSHGTGRVLYRCLQVYFAHILMFGLLAFICVMGNRLGIGPDYIKGLNLAYAFENPTQALTGLLTLQYVPNYFDILPMYIVIMFMIPLVWLLAQYSRALALAFPIGLYALTSYYGWELNAEMTHARPWFFNPLSWQLLFFSGFALAAGWLPRLRWSWAAGILCLGFLGGAAMIEYGATFFHMAQMKEWRHLLHPYVDKSHLGLLRLVHFLALAYVVAHAAALVPKLFRLAPMRVVAQLGRHSLPAFVIAMALSYIGGMALDYYGRDLPTVAAVNIIGLALFYASVRLVGFSKKLSPRTAPATLQPFGIKTVAG